MQYLYADGDNHVFMDNESFEQTELSSDYLKEELNYLKRRYGSTNSNIRR